MITRVRSFLWRILGIDYFTVLNKLDYSLLKNDKYTHIGKRTYDNGAKVWRWTDAPLTIGNYCSIAYDVNFIIDEGCHTLSSITNFPLANNLFKSDKAINGILKKTFFSKLYQKEGIIIGNDVWIGMGTYILPRVKVGNGVTIAVNSVVTKNIPDYALVGGIPAKIIRMKHDEETILRLNKIAWWHWSEETVKERIEDFYILDIHNFISKYSN